MQLIDIGANLTHNSFQHDLNAVLTRARTHNVTQLVVTGASREGAQAAYALALAYSGVLYSTAGVHPHHASEFDVETETCLQELLTHPECLAVGETGLDYYRDLSPRSTQRFAFERQLTMAVDCGKPLFLHQRDAHADFLACLNCVRDKISRAVVHCFTGNKKELFDYLDRDFYIGITGWICDERRGLHLRELMREIPASRLMLETDSPYLLPRNIEPMPSHRRNEPMYLAHICAEVARARGEALDITATTTTAAARAFFGIPAPE